MTGQNFVDEIDCGSFFDHIDDLIEFPSVSDTALDSVDCNDFPSIWTNGSDELPVSDPIFSGGNGHSASALSEELAVPYEDIVQLEWLSNFVEDSFSGGGMTMSKEPVSASEPPPPVVAHYQFQSSSPVSVLESSSSSSTSSSCSGGGKMIPVHRGPQRARSKRPRPANFNPRAAIELLSPLVVVPRPVPVPSEPRGFIGPRCGPVPIPAEPTGFIGLRCGPEQKKKKKTKQPKIQCGPAEENEDQNQSQTGQGVRKCLHCEITKTPQWRAGPTGPKTLCNACGVRYKSGRLFPEYRPAASPTFVPSLHSNSHKKVVEMRTKVAVVGPNDKPENDKTALPEPEPGLTHDANGPSW